jgi:hypothetical protein
MRKVPPILALFGLVFAASSCSYSTAVISSDRSAFVVKNSIFSSSMYYCKSVQGVALCSLVKEKD